jgi:nucleotide-binding universal stress UspA family protein
MQIEKVLVPMDFSPPSRLALNHGIAFARKFRARLTLLHVVESSSALTYTFPTETERIEKEHSEQAQRMLSTLVGPEDQDDLDLQTLVKTGDIEDEILSTIREKRTDLVVMGTHGRGLVGRSLIGSVTQKVLRKVEIPILTVCRVARFPAFDRILFATDLSESSKEGSRFVLELARMTNSNLIALHAVEVGLNGGAEAAVYLGENRLEEARAKLDEFKVEAFQQEIKVETVLAEAPVADTILKAAEENSADLIVITVQKRGMLDRALLGSTAERVIREVHIPVLSIPVGAKAKPEQTEETSAA